MQNVGVLSVESGDLQSSGLAKGQKQIGFSFNRSSVKIRKLNHVPTRIDRLIQSINIIGGLGLVQSTSLWGQFPVVKTGEKRIWTVGDPAFGVRFRSPSHGLMESRTFFVNQGFVFPVGDYSTASLGEGSTIQDGTSTPLPVKGVYVSRTVGEIWDQAFSERTFGLQMLLDLPLSTNDEGIKPGRAFQLSGHAIDHRFSKPGLVPFVGITFRNQQADTFNGNPILNSGGWFVHGIAALDVRVSPNYSATVSISAPWIMGMEGTKLRQINMGLSLRWTSPLDD